MTGKQMHLLHNQSGRKLLTMLMLYQDLKEKLDIYFGQGTVCIFFLCALLFWAVNREKSRQMRLYVTYVVVSLLAMMNPISLYIIDKSGNMDVYERFFWLLMTPVMVSVTFAVITGKRKGLMLLCLLLLLLGGKSVFTTTEYKPAENPEKISEQAILISDMIMRDFEELPEDAVIEPNRVLSPDACPRALVTEPISEDIRMYNANILLYYVRKNFGSYKRKGFYQTASLVTMETNEIPADKVLRAMKKKKFTYLVLGDWQELTGNLSKYNISLIGQTENYRLYKYVPDPTYKVTQYADIEGYQCMSYTIESSDGGLVVVDGGRAWQSETLVNTIREKGGHVDDWIITHPHDDHCGVLASVMEAGWDNSEISIDRILVGQMNYEDVKEEPRSDTFGYLLMGLNARDNVTWLSAGDELSVIGLKMKVLHTCNDMVVRESDNIMNDGSMVFKLSAKKRSILFLADVADNNAEIAASVSDRAQGSSMGRRIADEILANFPEDVKSTYVQMSHHGNGSLPDYFYEAVSPKAAFFDAPVWLMENKNKETGQESYYSTPHYKALMETMGAEVISYSTKRRSVTLK